MARALVAFLAIGAIAACQGNQVETATPPKGSDVASGSAPAPRDAAGGSFGTRPEVLDGAVFAVEDAPSATVTLDARPDEHPDPDPPDPSKVIADLNAMPAWQAVVDRSQLLARREQHGVVFGRIGAPVMVPAPPAPATGPVDAGVPATPAVPPDAGPVAMIASPYVWLIDDTEGNGALGIRVALGTHTAAEGQRVALGGAWQLDDERRWFWKVDVVQPLPPAPASDIKDPVAAVPGHAIPNGELPYGARTITLAKEGDAAFFAMVGRPPANDGGGWPVANELGDVPYALLTLPGERPSYGGQDMRSPEERWQLRPGQMYWVRIGKIRKREGKPLAITARTAPVRVK